MEYRVVKRQQGWIAEYRKPVIFLNFIIKYKWHHVTHFIGLENEPIFYQSPNDARNAALLEINDKMGFSLDYARFYKTRQPDQCKQGNNKKQTKNRIKTQ